MTLTRFRPTGELVRFLKTRARPEVEWISAVMGVEDSLIDSTLMEIHDHMDVERTIYRSLRLGRRNYYAQFPAPLELYAMARILRPLHVVESGVSSGLSSAHFLMALLKNGRGKLHSIDLPEYQKAKKRGRGELSWSIPFGKDSGWAIPTTLKRGWDLRKGKSEDHLPALVEEVGTVDFFCHDSPWTPEHLAFEFETIRPKLRSGSVVVADNTGMNPRAVKRLATDISAKVCHRKGSSLIGMRMP